MVLNAAIFLRLRPVPSMVPGRLPAYFLASNVLLAIELVFYLLAVGNRFTE